MSSKELVERLDKHKRAWAVSGNIEKANDMDEAAETIRKFHRLLNPVFMSLAYEALAGKPLDDDAVLFHHMGGGGSDMTYVRDFRELMGDERE